MSKILITGARGQIGNNLAGILGGDGLALTRDVFSLAEPDELRKKLDIYRPKAIINAAAYTAVDKAEKEPERAELINAKSVGVLAEWAFENSIPFIQYSTDYVFDGSGVEPWKEEDKVAPLSSYAKSKLSGEQEIQRIAEEYEAAKWLILRTSWVYDANGQNFLNTMFDIAQKKEVINVVSDQVGSPTYAPDIAEYTIKILDKATSMDEFPSGIYHLCNNNFTSWHGFAEAIFSYAKLRSVELAVKNVEAVGSEHFARDAQRPLNSRLSTKKLQKTFDLQMPNWDDAMRRCISKKIDA